MCLHYASLACDHYLTISPKLGLVQGHHLYGRHTHPEILFLPENGIFLLTFFHLEFHKKTRTLEKITPENFVSFLKNMEKNDIFLLSFIDSIEKEYNQKGIALPSFFQKSDKSLILDGIKKKIVKRWGVCSYYGTTNTPINRLFAK